MFPIRTQAFGRPYEFELVLRMRLLGFLVRIVLLVVGAIAGVVYKGRFVGFTILNGLVINFKILLVAFFGFAVELGPIATIFA